MCKSFILLSNFVSTITTYFILTMNLHAIATANLALKLSNVIQCKEERNDFLREDVDSCSNATYDTLDHKRTLTIDYSSGLRWKTNIRVVIPNLIVWLIAFFILFPSFFVTNATIGDLKSCFVRLSYDTMSILGLSEITMILIQTFVPVSLIFLTLLVVCFKKKKVRNIDDDLVEENLKNIIKTAISVASIFLTFQAPKLLLDAILLFLRNSNVNLIKCVLYMMYYFGIFTRLILCRMIM